MSRSTLHILSAASALALVTFASPARAVGGIDCELSFDLAGWSVFYETASGDGKVRCDNGQSIAVHISARGGGLSLGQLRIENGTGEFSRVGRVRQIRA